MSAYDNNSDANEGSQRQKTHGDNSCSSLHMFLHSNKGSYANEQRIKAAMGAQGEADSMPLSHCHASRILRVVRVGRKDRRGSVLVSLLRTSFFLNL